MLSLREYADRLEAHPDYQLNKKPRQIDCLIIDKKDGSEPIDLSIVKIFSKHNIKEYIHAGRKWHEQLRKVKAAMQ